MLFLLKFTYSLPVWHVSYEDPEEIVTLKVRLKGHEELSHIKGQRRSVPSRENSKYKGYKKEISLCFLQQRRLVWWDRVRNASETLWNINIWKMSWETWVCVWEEKIIQKIAEKKNVAIAEEGVYQEDGCSQQAYCPRRVLRIGKHTTYWLWHYEDHGKS